jgi:hypothetical protein
VEIIVKITKGLELPKWSSAKCSPIYLNRQNEINHIISPLPDYVVHYSAYKPVLEKYIQENPSYSDITSNDCEVCLIGD